PRPPGPGGRSPTYAVPPRGAAAGAARGGGRKYAGGGGGGRRAGRGQGAGRCTRASRADPPGGARWGRRVRDARRVVSAEYRGGAVQDEGHVGTVPERKAHAGDRGQLGAQLLGHGRTHPRNGEAGLHHPRMAVVTGNFGKQGGEGFENVGPAVVGPEGDQHVV